MSTWSLEHDQNENKTKEWDVSAHVNVLFVLVAYILNSHAASPSITTSCYFSLCICGGEMFDQAAGVHRSSSSAVYRLCAVPTGCSGGLRPCVWRGAEGRRAPRWGGRTGAAGTVLLPQERAVQTAWRSGGATHSHTQPNTKIQTHKDKQKTRGDAAGQRDVDETGRQDRQKAREGGE